MSVVVHGGCSSALGFGNSMETARHQGSRSVHANTDVFGRPDEIDGQLLLSKGLWLRSIQAQ